MSTVREEDLFSNKQLGSVISYIFFYPSRLPGKYKKASNHLSLHYQLGLKLVDTSWPGSLPCLGV